MSRVPYYYYPSKTLHMIHEPGELCDFCGNLSEISKAGTKVPMPCDAMHEEYGGTEGNIHACLPCAEKAVEEYKRLYKESATALANFRAGGTR